MLFDAIERNVTNNVSQVVLGESFRLFSSVIRVILNTATGA